MKCNKILVPVDFSEYSNKATEFAIQLGERFGSELTLIHVITLFQSDVDEINRFQGMEGIVTKQEKQIQQEMHEKLGSYDSQGVTIKSTILKGFSAAKSILEYISLDDFDLIVMATQGRTGIKHLLLGSTTEKIVQHAKIPVLTLHKTSGKCDFLNILVPIDFSEYSKHAVEHSLFLANRFDADITFMYVIEHEYYIPNELNSAIIPDINSDLHVRSTENLKKFVGINDDYAAYTISQGRAHRKIVEYAKDSKIDLIVMATRGLSGLDHMLMGSTAERVVRNSECPVLTVSGKE